MNTNNKLFQSIVFNKKVFKHVKTDDEIYTEELGGRKNLYSSLN